MCITFVRWLQQFNPASGNYFYETEKDHLDDTESKESVVIREFQAKIQPKKEENQTIDDNIGTSLATYHHGVNYILIGMISVCLSIWLTLGIVIISLISWRIGIFWTLIPLIIFFMGLILAKNLKVSTRRKIKASYYACIEHSYQCCCW